MPKKPSSPNVEKLAILAVALIATSLGSCASVPRIPVSALPPAIEGVFTVCSSGDGGVSLSVVHAGKFLGSGQVDWVSDRDRLGTEWEVEVRNPLGQIILNLSLAGTELRHRGVLDGSLRGIQVRKDGFLEVDGHFVALKASEVPCFLKFRFPREWATHVVELERLQNRIVLEIAPEQRQIHMTLDDLSASPAKKICAQVSWRSWLGLVKSVATICHEYDKRKKTTIILDDLEIRWIDTDDATS